MLAPPPKMLPLVANIFTNLIILAFSSSFTCYIRAHRRVIVFICTINIWPWNIYGMIIMGFCNSSSEWKGFVFFGYFQWQKTVWMRFLVMMPNEDYDFSIIWEITTVFVGPMDNMITVLLRCLIDYIKHISIVFIDLYSNSFGIVSETRENSRFKK